MKTKSVRLNRWYVVLLNYFPCFFVPIADIHARTLVLKPVSPLDVRLLRKVLLVALLLWSEKLNVLQCKVLALSNGERAIMLQNNGKSAIAIGLQLFWCPPLGKEE